MAEDDDGDAPALSSHARAALEEFLMEKRNAAAQAQQEEEVEEDWALSQFWYDDATAQTLAFEVAARVDGDVGATVACVACPSLFVALKRRWPEIAAHLFEYDRRFSRHGCDFTYYDYNHPEDLPDKLKHSFQVVICDPPYLSQECLEKTSEAVRLLSKDARKCPVLLLTGAVQQQRALSLMGLRPCRFRPCHKHKLGNEFKVYTNYKPPVDFLGGWDDDEDTAPPR